MNTKISRNRRLGYIFQNQLDKTCFEHDKTCGDLKDLPRRTASDKI